MLTNAILADIGLPMVALYLPFAWFALVPIILIEAAYGSRRYNLAFRRAFLAEAVANCLSTVIGIPATWLALVLLQFVTVPSGTGPAWLLPDPSWWAVAGAIAGLTVVFYIMSVATEGLVVARFLGEIPRKAIRRWMLQANGITYALLLALILGGLLAPTVSRPIMQPMQPVNEGIVGGAFWIVHQISGKQEKEPPLIQAVQARDLRKAQKLIANGSDANQAETYGFSALFIAARAGDEKMTQLLLYSGADVNARSGQINCTPLQIAAQFGTTPTVRALLAAGARVDDQDGSGWTPLFMAALSGKLDVIEELLAAGANVNARSSSGWTALKEAQMRGYENVAQRLKLAGAVDFPDGSRSERTQLDSQSNMNMKELTDFAQRYADAWYSQDPEKVAAFYARNGSISVNGAMPVPIAEVARGFMRDFPDMVVTFDKLENKPTGTEFHWTFTGTSTGPGGTGKRVRISGYELWKIDNDRLVVESKGHFDAAEYERQLKHGVDK